MGFLVYPSKKGYRVVQEFWEPKRHSKTVPRESYSAFGFHPNMTLEEARLRASQINQQDQLEKARIAEAARRVELQNSINEAYLPKNLTMGFELSLHEKYSDNPERLRYRVEAIDQINKVWCTRAYMWPN